MNIAIVGDFEIFHELTTYLKNFSNNNNIMLRQNYFPSEEVFTKNIGTDSWQLIFLISSENNPTIIYVSRLIKKQHSSCTVVYISKSSNFAVLGYELGISYYLIYPFDFNKLENVLLKASIKEQRSNKFIVCKHNWQKKTIPIKDIIFIEKFKHNVLIHTPTETIKERSSLKKFSEKLNNDEIFINCIKGIIVNLMWVAQIEKNFFILKSNEKIPIRRQDVKKINEIYFNFKQKE